MVNKDLKDERRDYISHALKDEDLTRSPFELLATWLEEAKAREMDHTAMTLATSSNGIPSARVVLLKEIKDEKIVFFSNYGSQKGQDISQNPNVCVNFFWPTCERQVRINGLIKKIAESESDEYFNSRPRESRIGAHTSLQSQPIASREELDRKFKATLSAMEGQKIERPSNWGGYEIEISKIEFWQGRASRLHDRIEYKLNEGVWTSVRLQP